MGKETSSRQQIYDSLVGYISSENGPQRITWVDLTQHEQTVVECIADGDYGKASKFGRGTWQNQESINRVRTILSALDAQGVPISFSNEYVIQALSNS